jgi:hypothetical protein
LQDTSKPPPAKGKRGIKTTKSIHQRYSELIVVKLVKEVHHFFCTHICCHSLVILNKQPNTFQHFDRYIIAIDHPLIASTALCMETRHQKEVPAQEKARPSFHTRPGEG